MNNNITISKRASNKHCSVFLCKNTILRKNMNNNITISKSITGTASWSIRLLLTA